MRRILVLLLSLALFGAVQAGTYGGPGNTAISTTKYGCNWSYAPITQWLVKTLRTYQIKTLILPNKIKIVIPDAVLFQSNSTQMYARAKWPLQYLRYFIGNIAYSKIAIIGYMGDGYNPAMGKQAALHRAQAVAAHLWENAIPDLTQVLGFSSRGEKDPIASNQYVNGMALNRRVEVIITVPTDNC